MEPMSWALVGIFGGGFLLNKVRTILADRHQHAMDRTMPPKEVCQCSHQASFHAGDGCNQQVDYLVEEKPVTNHLGSTEYHRRWSTRPCQCLHYVGPHSVPELTMPANRTRPDLAKGGS